MRKGKGDLTRVERFELKILVDKGYSQRAIARALGRGKSTISYEMQENSVGGTYDPLRADQKARHRKRMRRLMWSKIEHYPRLKQFIVEKLKAHWNPDEIAGYLRRNPSRCPQYVSKTAIYVWLRTARGERYCQYLYSGRVRVKRRRKKVERVMIPNRVDITKRPPGADNRTRYGHVESDTIVGRKGTPGGLKVISERKSRLVRVQKVKSMRPGEHVAAEAGMLQGAKTLSITRDNGIENRDYASVGIPSFFCRPYASWQKGGVENVNKMLRYFFPKGTDFRTVSQSDVDRAVTLINEKPRKILGYRSAREVAEMSGMMDGIKSGGGLTVG